MNGRLSFLVIEPETGGRRRFSVHAGILYTVVVVVLILLASGIIGMFKYRENIYLKNRCKLLEAEKNKMEAVARTVQDIEREETRVREMLGLAPPEHKGTAPPQ